MAIDLVFNLAGGTGSGQIPSTHMRGDFQTLPGSTLRFDREAVHPTLERAFTSAFRIPAGIALDFSLATFSGTPTFDQALVHRCCTI